MMLEGFTQMRALRSLLVLVVVLGALSGCGNLAGALTPEEAVRRSDVGPLQQMQIVGVRFFDDRAVVLYTGRQLNSAGDQFEDVLGYTFVARTPNGWRAENRGGRGSSGPPDPATKLDYSVATTQTDTQPRTIVYGRALTPEITAVEAVFNDGRTARDEVANGVFAIAAFGADGVCAVRVLNAQGKELELPGHVAAPPGAGC